MSNENLYQPTVSVIVPVYKSAGTLEACIKSIQNQTYQNIEIILVNDGSPDNSGEICDEFADKDSRISVIHQKNSGVSVARNNGIKEASSDFLCFVDSDDEITPDCIEKLVEAQQKSGSQLTVGGMSLYHKNETLFVAEPDRECDLNSISASELRELCGNWIMCPMTCRLFSKQIISDNNLLLENGLVCGEDHLFIFEYLYYCDKVTFIDDILYRYYCFNSNGQSRFFPLKGQIKIFEAKCRLIKKHCSTEEYEAYCANQALHNFRVRVDYLAKRYKEDIPELNQAYEHYWKYVKPLLGNDSVFSAEDLEWLNANKTALTEGNIRPVYKKAEKFFKSKKSSRKMRNIKEFLAMPFGKKIRFVIKKILRK